MNMKRSIVTLAGLAALVSARPQAAAEHGNLTIEEALELAFGKDALVEKSTLYLTEAELEHAKELCDVEVTGKILRPHVAKREGVLLGTAYFETHEVRTKQETMMIVVDTHNRIGRIEVLAFREPPEYLPRHKWYEQFTGHDLDEDLSLKREIRGVTGATLTSVATTDAARRTLALHQLVLDREEAERKRREEREREEREKREKPPQ